MDGVAQTLPGRNPRAERDRTRIACVVFLAVSVFLLLGSGKPVCCAVAILLLACYLAWSRRISKAASLLICAPIILLLFSPIDVYVNQAVFGRAPARGRVHLVPFLMGRPNTNMMERAKRGEVVLGGCITFGFEPKYLLVW